MRMHGGEEDVERVRPRAILGEKMCLQRSDSIARAVLRVIGSQRVSWYEEKAIPG